MLVVSTCTERTQREKPLVLVTIKPLELIVREIVGDSVEVRTLLPAGVDPHHYEPTPSDAESVSEATLLIRVGGHLDEWASKLPAKKTVELLDYVYSCKWSKDYVREEGHSDLRFACRRSYADGSDDPHFWLNAVSVKDTTYWLTKLLVAELPSHSVKLEENAQAFCEQLWFLDGQTSTALWEHRGKCVIQAHDSLQYLLRAHEIQSVGVIEAHSGIEPSPLHVAQLIATAKAKQAKCVIVDAGHSDKAAKLIAQECGIPLVHLDPEAVSTEREYASYFEWYKWNVEQLAEALK
ncbi:MAG: metal ABC transporter substrate-binding protein [bacterium]|nr:metal ABC transporter substrate-binding protein [bacterium]